ncbi:MAG: ATP-binding protein [Acholeplasmatales bacterium]|nr:ATP-binding protein [Acholeplasmataceae bacterium]MDY0115642.1 ATP-binding protein [Acholeplasmatales bacterium]MCK9234100.1 ATP-binding protein [Acholeplasmataceae bacterium]MCK9289599.1 ATP-binding protein [Acholeplasmataceae bacterium]MCK9427984.1 ATP-binding protein [Acholeplasmataceae bacterium]
MNSPEMYLNIPRIYTAIAQFLAVSIFVFFNVKKFNKKKTIAIATFYLFLLIAFHYWANSWHLNLWIIGMITSVLIMYSYLLITTKLSYRLTGFYLVIAFVIAELIASIEWQIEYFFITNNNVRFLTASLIKNHHLRVSLIFLLMYFGLFSVIFFIERRYFKEKKFIVSNIDLITILITGVLVFTISNLSFLNINTPITSEHTIEIFYIRTLVNLSGIILIYMHKEHKFSAQKSLEINNIKKLLEKQYENYQLSESQINLINKKHHDLKHYLSVIKNETNIDKKLEHVKDLEKSISGLYYQFQTGNNVLDIILFSKQDILKENNINFTCVVDGLLLADFEINDIISIFSNLLDNAIESVKLVINPDKRIINLAVFKEGDFLVIRLENYYEHKLKFQDGRFLTTKGDKDIRGFGIKSITSTVEKYQGTFKILTPNNWFKSVILLPIKNESKGILATHEL